MDKRIETSIRKIEEAYKKLLMKEEPNKIQIKEICALAGVNRSTFYDRYGYIESLEGKIIQDEMKNLIFKDKEIYSLLDKERGIDKTLIRGYIESFLNNKILLRFCTVSGREKYVDIIAHKQVELCASNLENTSYYNAYFQCLGALTTLIEWINKPNGCTIDDIVDIVYIHSEALFLIRSKDRK